MDKERKILGVIMSFAEGNNQSRLIQGIQKQAYELDYDVLIFTTFIKDELTPKWQYGEHNIYNAINYDMLDGIILVLDSILVQSVADKIVREIKQVYNKPVVVIEIDVDGFQTVKTNDVAAIKKMVCHLIEDHNFSDIAFVTGKIGHPHSEKRLEGYYEAIIEHNLPIDKSRTFYGDFWYHCAEGIVEQLIKSDRPLPQAVACACDATAIGIIEAFKKRGINVPEDIAVTGYDSAPAGVQYNPAITSCIFPSENTGLNAVIKIHSMITSGPYEPIEPSEIQMVYGQSCGCSYVREASKIFRPDRWLDDINPTDFNSVGNDMIEELISSSDIMDFFYKVSWFTYHIGTYEHIDICMCENWSNSAEDERQSNYLKKGYTQTMYQVLKRGVQPESTHIDINRRFNLEMVSPTIFEKREKPTAFFVTPIHFFDRCFGYSVITYGDVIRSYDADYRMVIKYIDNALESFRRQKRLEDTLRHVRESSITDAMTGIYNRNGYNLYAEEIFSSAQMNNKKMLVIIGDLNNLKYINDNYGHINGDIAIIAAAKAFKNAALSSKICFRFGGDEFVMIDSGEYTDSELMELQETIRGELFKSQNEINRGFDISMSLGMFYGYVEDYNKIEQVISIADDRMFEDKMKYKRK